MQGPGASLRSSLTTHFVLIHIPKSNPDSLTVSPTGRIKMDLEEIDKQIELARPFQVQFETYHLTRFFPIPPLRGSHYMFFA